MKKFNLVVLCTSLMLLFSTSLMAQTDTADIYLSVDFENHALGAYTNDSVEKYWPLRSISWVANEGVNIVDCTGVDGQTSRMLQAHFEKGDEEDLEGFEWMVDLGYDYDEVYLSYHIKLCGGDSAGYSEYGFKNPGIEGNPAWEGTGKPGDQEGFTSPLHPYTSKEYRFYIYHHDGVPQYGEVHVWKPFVPRVNQWYTVTIRVTMNSFTGGIPNADGIHEGFINWKKIKTVDDIENFENEHDTMKIDGLNFGLFRNQSDGDPELPETFYLIDNVTAYCLDSAFAVDHGYAWGLGDTNAVNQIVYAPIDIPVNVDIFDTIYTAESGTCKDKNGDSDYDDFADELQKIYVQNADSIKLTINTVDVESDYDLFIIIEGCSCLTSNYIYFDKADIASSTEYMIDGECAILRLISDYSSNRDGFDIDYEAYVTEDSIPIVNITATDSSASEYPLDQGLFTVSRNQTSDDLTVYYTKSGTTSSSDYTETLPGSVVISDGNSNATIQITPVNDTLAEGDETLILTLSSDTGYSIGSPASAVIYIYDDDSCTLPSSPTSLSAAVSGSTQVNLSWTDNSDNEEGFKVERKEGAGAFTQIDSTSENITSYSDTTVEAETQYTYRVRAYNDCGNSSFSNEDTVYVPDEGDLIAHWPFNGNANDTTGNHDATEQGGLTYSTNSKVGSYSAYLNGTGKYFDCGTINLGNEFTVTGWYYAWWSSGYRTLFASTYYNSEESGIISAINGSTGQFIITSSNGSSTDNATSTTGNHETGEWIHFAFVVDRTNGVCRTYINGDDESNDTTILTDFDNNETLNIGEQTNGSYNIWGRLDDIRIYGYKLSASEIDSISNLLKSTKGKEEPEINAGCCDEVKYYPVPFRDILHLTNTTEIKMIKVLDILGETKMIIEPDGRERIDIKTEDLPKGLYMLKLVSTEDNVELIRVVKN